jgi:hypothetical protein
MKRWTIILAILATVGGLLGWAASSQKLHLFRKGTPKIVFEATKVDFGEEFEGEEVACTFSFKNKGNGALILYKARTNCGCLKAEPSRTRIPPGQSGELRTVYDTRDRSGDLESTVLLVTNDPKAEFVKLTIGGKVKKPYIHPRSIDFGEARAKDFAEKTVVITKLTKAEMQITDVNTSKPWLNARFVADNTTDLRAGQFGRDYQLVVAVAGDAPIGLIREHVSVSVLMKSSNPQRNIRIPVKGYVQGDVVCEPKSIVLDTGQRGKAASAQIILTANFGNGFEVRDVKSQKGFVRITGVDPAETSATIHLELEKNLDMEFVSDIVVITTNSDEVPEISVPVYARIVANRPGVPVAETAVQAWREREVMPMEDAN